MRRLGRRILEVDVDGHTWIKRGSVVAYTGDLKFHLDPVAQTEPVRFSSGPIRSAVKRELVPISKAVGTGRVLLSGDGLFTDIHELSEQAIFVMASGLLAFEPSLKHELLLLGAAGALGGGLIVVKLSGTGVVATSAAESVTLPVSDDVPVSVDPAAAVHWTDGLVPHLKTDLDAGSIIGHGGGQPVQFLFAGNGSVTVQAKPPRDLGASLRNWSAALMLR